MMSMGLRCRLVGRPGRIGVLVRFVDDIADERVWAARHIDIAEPCIRHHPAA